MATAASAFPAERFPHGRLANALALQWRSPTLAIRSIGPNLGASTHRGIEEERPKCVCEVKGCVIGLSS